MKRLSVYDQRTLRFVCGWQSCREGPHQSVTIVAAPTLKRQCVDKRSVVQVHLVELIRDRDKAPDPHDTYYGLFVWPSALVLAQFIAQEARWLCHNKVVLELGCGTGLPSILSGLCGAAKIYLTDRADASDVQRNAEANIKLNQLEDRAEFHSLTWGDMHVSDRMISIFQTVQVVLAADCFYQSADFEKVIATVALIFRCSIAPSCRFYVSYQLRSITRSIAFLLSRWQLAAQPIDKSAYIGFDHAVHDVDSIYLYEVKRAV